MLMGEPAYELKLYTQLNTNLSVTLGFLDLHLQPRILVEKRVVSKGEVSCADLHHSLFYLVVNALRSRFDTFLAGCQKKT